MNSPMNDWRYAFRSLSQSPGFTAVAVLTLALGIGANSAIFSVFHAVLLTPPPFRDPARLVFLAEKNPHGELPVSYPNFLDWRRMSKTTQGMAAFRPRSLGVTGSGQAEKVSGKLVSSGFFEVLGVPLLMGRTFTREEDLPGANPVVLLSQGFWERNLGGDRAVLGKAISVEGQPHTIIGVAPAGFRIYGDAEVFLPLGPAAYLEARNDHNALFVVARLKPGASRSGLVAEMDTIGRQLERQYPNENAGESIAVTPLGEKLAGWMRPMLLVLFGAVGFILLIACVNLANLMLARSTEREKEFALRAALGAGRWQVARRFITESLVLSFGGGLAGLILAAAVVPSLVAVAPGDLTADGVRVSGTVVLFTVFISGVTGVLFGIFPALRVARPDLNQSLKEAGRGASDGAIQHHLRSFLVGAQVGLALVLLIGAGLLIRSTQRVLAIDNGFRPDNVLTMRLAPSDNRFLKAATTNGKLDFTALIHTLAAYKRGLLERAQQIPGVRAAALSFPLPVAGETAMLPVQPEGRPAPADERLPSVLYYSVSPDYFRVMGIPLLQGRTFSLADDEGSPRVVVVNQTMARRYWPGENPIGKRFRLPKIPQVEGWCTVVGVAADTRHSGSERTSQPQFYMSFLQWPAVMFLVAKTDSDPMALAPAFRRTLADFDRELPVYDFRLLEDRLAQTRQYRRSVTLFLSIFAGLALVLTTVGVYGVMSYSVSRRTHDIGIRMALGARPGQVLRMVLTKVMSMAGGGALCGAVAALALTRLLSTLLFEVTPTDPLTFAGASALLLVVAFLAGYVPALRAARLEPTLALRHE